MSTEKQPYSTFNAMGVPANKVTELKLSGGKTIPYIYSLGINSTIPYVKLIGSAMGQKLFSWNERIEVPPGEMVTVANASFHPGDIWINSGWDPAVLPSRVTVPVGVSVVGANIEPDFPIDTRRALRAWVQGFPASGGPQVFTTVGIAKLRSHNVNPAFTYAVNATAEYTTSFTVPPFTSPGLLPLGQKAQPGDPVHALLDAASFQWGDVAFTTQSGAVYYVLEYR